MMEKETRLQIENFKNGLSDYVVRSKQPLFIPENMEQRMTQIGVDIIRMGTGEIAKCWLGVPMLEGERIVGVIAVQSIKREHVLFRAGQRPFIVHRQAKPPFHCKMPVCSAKPRNKMPSWQC